MTKFVMVPVEPTEEMHVAAVKAAARCHGNDDFPPAVYKAMIAAAPAPSATKDHKIREIVNQLRDISLEFHAHQSLRERIANVLLPALKPAPSAEPSTPYRPLTEFERAVVANFQAHMQEKVIPEIVKAIQEREVAASVTRHMPLLSTPSAEPVAWQDIRKESLLLRLDVEKLAELLTETEKSKRDIVEPDNSVSGVRIGWGAWALLRARIISVIERKCTIDEMAAAPQKAEQNDYLCPNCVTPWKCNGPHITQEEQIAGDALDAKRYRWLRDISYDYSYLDHMCPDAAIDAAIAQSEKPAP